MTDMGKKQNQESSPVKNDSITKSDQGNGHTADNQPQVVLSIPPENQNQIVTVTPGLELRAGFDLSNVSVETSGRHVLLQFENGGTITLLTWMFFGVAAVLPMTPRFPI